MSKQPKPSTAAAKLLATRAELAGQVAALRVDAAGLRANIAWQEARRAEILATPIPKAEYIERICLFIDREHASFAGRFANKLACFGQSGRPRGETPSIATAGYALGTQEAGQVFRNLFTAGVQSTSDFTVDAAYLYLHEAVKAALRGSVSDLLDWPFAETISIDAARKEIAAIDAELTTMNATLAELVDIGASFGETI